MLENLSKQLSIILIEKKELEDKEKELKEEILKIMESRNQLTVDNEYIRISYVLPQKRVSLDTNALKKNDENLYDELMAAFSKETVTKPSLRITIRG